MDKLMEYHFSLGNSTDGPVGFCATVRAKNRAEAVEILRATLPDEWEIPACGTDEENRKVVYIQAYFNDKAVTEAGIDEEEEA